MTNPQFLGYLNNPDGYLNEDGYLGDTGLFAHGMQVELRIVDRTKTQGMEVARHINDRPSLVGMETNRQILDRTAPVGMEVDRITVADLDHGMEIDRQITDYKRSHGMQVELTVLSAKILAMEVERFIKNLPNSTGMEIDRQVLDTKRTSAMEIRLDHSIAHWLTEGLGYLEEPYLTDPYLGPGMIGQMGMTVERTIKAFAPQGMEVERVITSRRTTAMEVLRRIIDATVPSGIQVELFRALTFGHQIRRVIYNTTNLRIMQDFPSRGTSGINWTASSTEPGDFSVNNLNTDIVEQRWESASGVKSVVLTCDTEITQGILVDTLAILGHNLTTSATITVEGSDNGSFSPVEQTFAVVPTRQNAYYIAPTFPTMQSRYWRLLISDPTNPNTSLQIGTIVFGTTIIFQGECFTDDVRRARKHFADKVATEGFTNATNDRALKRAIGLNFKFLKYRSGNWRSLDNLFDVARTSLKCLWIPDPQDPTRFAVFAKLTTIPDEMHKNMGDEASDTLDFTVDLDESQ